MLSSIFPVAFTWRALQGASDKLIVWLRTQVQADPYAQRLDVPQELLTPDAVHEVQLQLRTSVGATSEVANVLVLVDTAAELTLTLNAPAIAYRTDALVMRSTIALCEGIVPEDAGISWAWAIPGRDLGLGGAALRRRDLLVPPFTLPVNETIVFAFTAFYLDGSRPNVSSIIALAVRPSTLSVTIAGADFIVVPVSSSLVLNASASYDPDHPGAPLSMQWSCGLIKPTNVSASSTGGCVGSDGKPLDLSNQTGPVLILPPHALPVGTQVAMRAHGRSTTDLRTASAQTTVLVQEATTVAISLSVLTAASVTRKASACSKLTVLSTLLNARELAGTLTFAWTVSLVGGLQCSGDCPPGATQTLPHTVALDGPNIIVPGSGVLQRGATYSFALRAVSAGGAAGYASRSVLVNRPPFGGDFDVQPRSGVAQKTRFKLSAPSWLDDDPLDLPLRYTFYYFLEGAGASNARWAATRLRLAVRQASRTGALLARQPASRLGQRRTSPWSS